MPPLPTRFNIQSVIGVPGPPGPNGTGFSMPGTGLFYDAAGVSGLIANGSAGQVLTMFGGLPAWSSTTLVTWANDLASSTTTSQWVSGISGSGGTGGAVTLGDGVHQTSFQGVASLQFNPPNHTFQGSSGFVTTLTTAGGSIYLIGGTGAVPTAVLPGGTGGVALVQGGHGGDAGDVSQNAGRGGHLQLASGSPGAFGVANIAGNILFQLGASTVAFVSAIATGIGFGVGGTPGTDPTLTRGTGIPATTQPNGSLFMRTDGSTGTALYSMQGAVWAPVGGVVTWANDLATSTNTNQYVGSISGANGTGGLVLLGDGVHTTSIIGKASQQTTPPSSSFASSNGWTANSGVGGTATFTSGTGGSGAAGNNTAGVGGRTTLSGGAGGLSTGSAANANGADIWVIGGIAGSGGSGAAGVYGNILLGNSTFKAFCTDNAAGPGFGIGTTPGTDPTLTRGTGVPATTQPNGSLFLRTDGTGTTGLYTRQSAAWVAVGGTTTTWATDLVNSTNTNQYVSGLSFDSTGAAGAGGSIGVHGTTTVLNWLNNAVTLNWTGTTVLSLGLNAADSIQVGPVVSGFAATPNGLTFGVDSVPIISQTILEADEVPTSFTIFAQSALPGASTNLRGADLILKPGAGATTNGTPGNVVVQLADATGTGNMGALSVKSGTQFTARLGPAQADNTAGHLWLGQTHCLNPSGSNFFLRDDGATAQVNAGTTLWLDIGGNPQLALTASGLQFCSNTFDIGGGNQVIGIHQTTTIPTSMGSIGIIAWANFTKGLGLAATGIAFHKLAGAISINQDNPTTDIVPGNWTVQAQSAWTSASTNVNGADLTLKGGDSKDLQGVSSLKLAGAFGGSLPGSATLTAYSFAAVCSNSISFQTAAIGGTSGNPWNWSSSSVAVASGTTTLSAAQRGTPLITLTGTLTGAVTVDFTNQAGFWVVDVSALVGVGAVNTLSFKSGTNTVVVFNAALPSTSQIVMVITNGANHISVNI